MVQSGKSGEKTKCQKNQHDSSENKTDSSNTCSSAQLQSLHDSENMSMK